MTSSSSPGWRLSLELPLASQGLFELALEDLGGALAIDVAEGRDTVTLQLYLPDAPDEVAVRDRLSRAAEAAGLKSPDYQLVPLQNRNWVADSQKALPPITAGRFYLHGQSRHGAATGG